MSQLVQHHPRRRKRKDREADASYPPPAPPKQNPAQRELRAEPEPILSNGLLAGYMAYEFLTRGTLLGQRFDPRRGKPLVAEAGDTGKYSDVAGMLRGDGAHIPGVINPSQLARWIQM